MFARVPFRTRWYMPSLRRGFHPPSHFNNRGSLPEQFSHTPQSVEPASPNNENESALQSPRALHHDSRMLLREFGSLVAMCALIYLALDNYLNRIKLEKLNQEIVGLNIKNLQVQKANFAKALQKKDLLILKERRDTSRRAFKMALHVALLRKQLSDLGHDPVDIESAVNTFENKVKINNSIQNVSGQSLWLEDDSRTYFYPVRRTHPY